MEAVWVPVIVALIGGPIMWFLSRFDKRNTEQHGRSIELLTETRDLAKSAVKKIDGHITWHAHKPE